MAASNRYSTFVVWVKVALPLIALALLSTMFLLSRKPDPDAALPFAEVDLEQLVREQRLSQPRFASTLADGREVTLVAATAASSPTDPNLIQLTEVETRMTLSEDDRLMLRARDGTVDLAARQVELSGEVAAETMQGLTLNSDWISLAMDEMHLVSPGAVTLGGPGMTLTAGAMDMTGPEGQAFVSFTGGVRVLYDAGDR